MQRLLEGRGEDKAHMILRLNVNSGVSIEICRPLHTYITDILKRSLATKLIGFSLGQAYMADHYKSLSHSGDGSKPFFPDPLGSCRP